MTKKLSEEEKAVRRTAREKRKDERRESLFLAKTKVSEAGCWEWTGAKDKDGYGQCGYKGKTTAAYRVAHFLFVGPIPEGMEPDHLCRNVACVRPSHLELVTHRENLMRGESFSAINAKKTRCPSGHEYTPENTRICRKGWRYCRECSRAHGRRRRSQTLLPHPKSIS